MLIMPHYKFDCARLAKLSGSKTGKHQILLYGRAHYSMFVLTGLEKNEMFLKSLVLCVARSVFSFHW